MAISVKPPEVEPTSRPTANGTTAPPASHAAIRPPAVPPDEGAFRIGPLFAALGILSLILMLVMVVTNYVLLAGARAPAAPAAGAAAPARPVVTGPASLSLTVSEFKFAPNELQMAGPGDLTVTVKNAGQ